MPQSLSSILLHLIFSTKHREPLINLEIEPELHAYLASVFRACNSPALSIGGDSDHIYTLFALSRTRALADVVEEVKKRSSNSTLSILTLLPGQGMQRQSNVKVFRDVCSAS